MPNLDKRVLVILYYWPPAGGSGVQRGLKFVKYLRDFGWEPVVYTCANPQVPGWDESLAQDIPEGIEVHRTKIFEPYSLFKLLSGKGKDEQVGMTLNDNESGGFGKRLGMWVRANLFIPDAKMFWIYPSIRYLKKYLRKNPVDAIVSSGPPHSVHLIAKDLQKSTRTPWLADFRDPWTGMDWFKDLPLTPGSDAKHRKLEKMILQTADEVTVVGSGMQEELEEKGGRSVEIITNGYDLDDSVVANDLDKEFTIAHIGMMSTNQCHPILWQALSELIEELEGFGSDLKLKFVGKVDAFGLEGIKKARLEDHLELIPYVRHSEAIKMQRESQLLYLTINNSPNAKGILTGKFFEYLAAKRPILAIAPKEGDIAKIIQETQAGTVSDFEDKEGLKGHIKTAYQKYKSGNLSVPGFAIEQFSRRSLTGKLADLLDKITSK